MRLSGRHWTCRKSQWCSSRGQQWDGWDHDNVLYGERLSPKRSICSLDFPFRCFNLSDAVFVVTTIIIGLHYVFLPCHLPLTTQRHCYYCRGHVSSIMFGSISNIDEHMYLYLGLDYHQGKAKH